MTDGVPQARDSAEADLSRCTAVCMFVANGNAKLLHAEENFLRPFEERTTPTSWVVILVRVPESGLCQTVGFTKEP